MNKKSKIVREKRKTISWFEKIKNKCKKFYVKHQLLSLFIFSVFVILFALILLSISPTLIAVTSAIIAGIYTYQQFKFYKLYKTGKEINTEAYIVSNISAGLVALMGFVAITILMTALTDVIVSYQQKVTTLQKTAATYKIATDNSVRENKALKQQIRTLESLLKEKQETINKLQQQLDTTKKQLDSCLNVLPVLTK